MWAPALIACMFSGEYAFAQNDRSLDIGFNYSIGHRQDWTPARADTAISQFRHADPSMPDIYVAWLPALSRDHAAAHGQAVERWAGDQRKQNLSWRTFPTTVRSGPNGASVYETELGLDMPGRVIRTHDMTIAIEDRLLWLMGGQVDDKSSVTWAREMANSLAKTEANSRHSQSTLVGTWSSPGAPNPAVIIFRENGTVTEDVPGTGQRHGRYKVSGSTLQLMWKGKAALRAETEQRTFRMAGEQLSVTHRDGPTVTYTRDKLEANCSAAIPRSIVTVHIHSGSGT